MESVSIDKHIEEPVSFILKEDLMELDHEQEEEKHTDSTAVVHQKAWEPSFYIRADKEVYYYAGHEITIWESLDSYGAVIWPAALALCHYLDTNRGTVNLLDRSVLEIGAGTGLVSIVASLLGAKVTASDLPEVLGNLRCNVSRNTRGRCRYTPQIMELFWTYDLKQTFPHSIYKYDYVLAADVVYHHDYLAELLVTMHHFCQPGTTLIWANKVRFGSDLVFLENFQKTFNTALLVDMGEVKIYSATSKDFVERTRVSALLPEETVEEEEEEEEEEDEKVNEKEKVDTVEEEGGERNIDVGDINKTKQQNQTSNAAELTLENSVNLHEVSETDQNPQKNLEEQSVVPTNKKTLQWQLHKHAPSEETPLDTENGMEDKEYTENSIQSKEMQKKNDKNYDDEPKESDDEDDVEKSSQASSGSEKENKSESEDSKNNGHLVQRLWAPTSYYRPEREIHYFIGHKITINESIDSYGGMIWPAAVALCKFLESPAGQKQINLLDKVTLELGAGTGLLSVAATLLGAKLTATDLPGILGNLRCNLNRNTRGYWRHEPQVAALSWGHDLEQTFPHSEYHYDYILAADVVYHHDYLAELLVTMEYFCQPGTKLIWANKVRYPSDLVFIENFTKAFHTTLIAELDEVRIYLAMHRDPEEKDIMQSTNTEKETEKECNWNGEKRDNARENKEEEEDLKKEEYTKKKNEAGRGEDVGNSCIEEDINARKEKSEEVVQHHQNEEDEAQHRSKEDYAEKKDEDYENTRKEEESQNRCEAHEIPASGCLEINGQLALRKIWEPSLYYRPDKEIHYFLGHKISIEESIDSYGAMIWPAAVALCKFLETPEGRQHINLLDKSVLEIGAGTGLVSIVATLLGARLTATDLPEILGNLRCNLNRNTRGLRKHEPHITELSWWHNLEENFPHSTYHYDYVLAADVVYHHDFLDELLVTMHHFCQPGTTLIWANKIRYPSDLVFIENFKKTFNTSLIAEVDDVKIYSGTYKEGGNEKESAAISNESMGHAEEQDKTNLSNVLKAYSGEVKREEDENLDYHLSNEMTEGFKERKDNALNEIDTEEPEVHKMMKKERRGEKENSLTKKQKNVIEQRCKIVLEEETTEEDEGYEEEETDEELSSYWLQSRSKGETDTNRTETEKNMKICEERHYFAGHEVKITDQDGCGTATRPAALALCKFLETNQHQINLKNKAVLELGAGTGLVSIVASLLGAWVTATDKPAALDNLTSNLSRNTRGFSKHTPQVEPLLWNGNLKQSFPRSIYRYDVVLAADVVYRHKLLYELLDTMQHFCQPGTILIWANKMQTHTEISFAERFKKAFNATLLTETGEVKIYMAKNNGLCEQRTGLH